MSDGGRRARHPRRLAIGLALLLGSGSILGGCTAMLLGDGSRAGRPIGTDTRSGAQSASDRSITAAVLERYAASEGLRDQRLRVETLRGVVTLRGSVDAYPLRDEAFRLASDVSGVQRVDNRIGIRR